jgi:hypothetical protein
VAIGSAIVVALIVVVNLLASGLDHAVSDSEPSGVTGSSYATNADGLAAYATLLTRFDHPVVEQRGPLRNASLDPSTTVVVVEPTDITTADEDALLDFVSAGGRLVIGGTNPYYVKNLRDHPPRWSATGVGEWDQVDPSLGGAQSIESQGTGSWTSTGSGRALVGGPQESLLTTDHVGQGDILMLADASPLANQYLARADNAALGLALAGPAGRKVVFAEGAHGYGQTRGIAAIPRQWKAALLVLLLAILVLVWSRARRFGPPDRAARELPPARSEYVRALSTTLERTHDPGGAFGPAQAWARDQIARRSALPPNASDDEIVRAARALGARDDEIASLFTLPVNNEQTLTLGRLIARVASDERRYG